MKRTSFFLRLFVGNLLLVAVIIALGGGVSYHYLNENYQRKTQQHQWHMLDLARNHLERRWPLAPEAIEQYAKQFEPDTEYRLTIIDLDGRVLGESDADTPAARMVNHKTPDRPEVLAAIDGHPGQDRRESDTLGVWYRYLALPVNVGDRPVAIVRLAMPIRAIAEEGDFIPGALFWGAASTIVAAVVLGLMVSWLWYRPLRLITEAARRLASGNLTQRPNVRGSAELEDLSTALNEMRLTVSNQLDLITAQRENLQTILANLGDGVIALDHDGHIVFMNHAARELLAPDEGNPTGRHFQAIVRVAEAVDVFGEMVAGAESVERQLDIDLRGRRFTLHMQSSIVAQHKTSDIWMVLVVRDVTDIARTGAMKAEFVANASHELRTPLATLRGVVDSFVDADATDSPETLAKYVDMLDRNVSRLENMTNDLLDLHAVEGSDLRTASEEIPLGAIVLRAQSQFGPRAREKSVRLNVNSSDEEFILHADRKLLELIVQNLLDNAIKFTPEGGTVNFEISPAGGEVVIRVEDSGCGISPEDQRKVFDRFFQANASRTGDSRMRGTGLGLAIVRHASDRLGASVELQSAIGQGTTVTLRIPAPAAEPAEPTG
ncbi:MAG: HAMP domain-containing protein [Planctomycetes bacterium]|nr:HAMP domain-containing protein [Phycisphaerae bacterium]NBB95920.1 HAMP domain-containing protein [Planctomycetota bacterium]